MDKRAQVMHSQLIRRMSGFGLLLAASFFLLIYHLGTCFPTQVNDEMFYNFFEGFQLGLIVTMLVVSFSILVRWMFVLSSEQRLVRMYIEEHDERAALIDQKAGSRAYYLSCVLSMIIIAVAAGYINATVFFTIIGCVLLMTVIRLILRAYYSRKL